jgi:hypothetical protein
MCLQVQSVTLQTAIFMQAKEFAQNNQPFSVHDITRTIREKTAQGELQIPEVEVSGASFRFDIPHAKVKALFDELYRTNAFDAEFTLSRNFNGMYFEYTPQLVGNVASTPAPATAPSPAPVVTPNYPWGPASSPSPAPVTPSVTPTDPNDISARVQQYLTNCASKNFRPSLKKIQSAIKRTDSSNGYSCAELKAYITKMGYTVVDDPDALSKSQVIV